MSVKADKCYEVRLLDGSEQLVDFGFDTTYNWWATTQSFSNRKRMYINEYTSENYLELSKPQFSPDGEKWAFFAKDMGGWNLITNEKEIQILADNPGTVLFGSDSQKMIYSFYRADNEFIISEEDTLQMRFRSGSLFINNTGDKFAFVESRGGIKTIYNDGKISQSFQDIIPFGYWHDDRFAYAAYDGSTWSVFIGNKRVSNIYQDISEARINLTGDYLAFIATLSVGRFEAVLISDMMSQPLTGKNYKLITGLAIHPHEPMLAYKALDLQNNEIVVFNSVEYSGGRENSVPSFSFDGSEMYFIACTIDCNLVVNGRRIRAPNGIFLDGIYARKPKSNSIAYATSTSLVVRDLETQILYAGAMMDYTGAVRFNWRMNEYESLGVINNRLYLQACGL